MHRVLFHIGSWPIYSFGVMVALGVLAASLLAARNSKRVGVKPDQTLEMMVWVVVFGVLGARFAFVAQQLPWFVAHPAELLNFRGGGMTFHGTILGVAATLAWHARKFGVRTAALLDLSGPSMMLGLAVGRVGCFLNGCCYGHVSALPWAVPMADEHSGAVAMRHPTQLYEMALALLAAGLLQRWFQRRRYDGEAFLGFLVLYSVIRFTVEFFRAGTVLAGGLTLAQFVSLALILVAGALLAWRRAPMAGAETTPA